MDALVGYTGFVGSNLLLQHEFDKVYNSSNIMEAYGTNPDLCVYAGVRAEKFLANNNPEADRAVIESAIENIKNINPKRLVLISTIDVFKTPYDCDENTPIVTDGLHAYGYNRYQFERWCLEYVENCYILRLPGLFGKGIKKNFIYDLIHFLPSTLGETKFDALATKESFLKDCYAKDNNGFYKLSNISNSERICLTDVFKRLNFSALNFTDSRAVFQFYNLAYLWKHIMFAVDNEISLLHLAVEPVSACELFHAVKGEVFVNEIADKPPLYDVKTIFAEMLGGKNGYIFGKQQIVKEIIGFVLGYMIENEKKPQGGGDFL